MTDQARSRVAATRDDVTFSSGDGRCEAWLYRPQGKHRPPVIVMGHGFGAVRELRLDAYAERFAEAGYAVLVFDYRHFGAAPVNHESCLICRVNTRTGDPRSPTHVRWTGSTSRRSLRGGPRWAVVMFFILPPTTTVSPRSSLRCPTSRDRPQLAAWGCGTRQHWRWPDSETRRTICWAGRPITCRASAMPTHQLS